MSTSGVGAPVRPNAPWLSRRLSRSVSRRIRADARRGPYFERAYAKPHGRICDKHPSSLPSRCAASHFGVGGPAEAGFATGSARASRLRPRHCLARGPASRHRQRRAPAKGRGSGACRRCEAWHHYERKWSSGLCQASVDRPHKEPPDTQPEQRQWLSLTTRGAGAREQHGTQ